MKKIIYLVSFLLFINFLTAAQQNNIKNRFTLGASLGLLSGKAEEIVYHGKNSTEKVSELLWDLKPLVYAGFDLGYKLSTQKNWGLFADTSFKFGIPSHTGVMEDRDWVFEQYPDWLTHYSVHNNKTETAILIDARAGASFAVFEKFFIKPFLAYSFMHFSWTGSGGSALHPYGDSLYITPWWYFHYQIPTSQTAITYRQTWHLVSPGVSFYGAFNRFFDIELFFNISPFVWCSAVDVHHTGNPANNKTYTDTMSGGLYIEPALLFSFTPHTLFSVAFLLAYRNIGSVRGDTVIRYNGISQVDHNTAGAGYSVFTLSITAKLNLNF